MLMPKRHLLGCEKGFTKKIYSFIYPAHGQTQGELLTWLCTHGAGGEKQTHTADPVTCWLRNLAPPPTCLFAFCMPLMSCHKEEVKVVLSVTVVMQHRPVHPHMWEWDFLTAQPQWLKVQESVLFLPVWLLWLLLFQQSHTLHTRCTIPRGSMML